MKILIDFTQIPVKKVGVGVYAYNLIKYLLKVDKENQYYILVQDDDNSFDKIKKEANIIKVKSKIFRNIIFRVILEQFYIPFLIVKYKIDVIHSLHYSFPIFTFKAKKVVTIHDMTFYLLPHFHLPLKKVYFKFFIFLSSKLADRIITVSKSTLKDYIDRFNFNIKHIYTIYHGRDKSFTSVINDSKVEEIKNKYGIKGDYLLFLGTIEPRKNIKNIILAFDKLVKDIESNLYLVIAGKKGWFYKEVFLLVDKLKLSKSVLFTGFIDELDKPYLMAGAKIFIYPSLYEGFGIPVLEALSCGVPTITSNVSSIPEITDNSAILIDPSNFDELYNAIVMLLRDKNLYNSLKIRSVKQARKFRWQKTAKETINVYKSLN